MKYLRNSFYLGILLLTLLAACGPATPTPLVVALPGPASTLVVALPGSATPTPLVVALPGPASTLLAQAAACIPPVPSISNVNSFCANKAAGLGGATWLQNPSDSDPSVAKDAAFIDNFTKNPDCSWDQTKVSCSGPQNAKVNYEICTTCGAPNNAALPPQGNDTNYGPNVCAIGYVNNGGFCSPVDPNKGFGLCPSGSHYDNALQNCADDVTNQLASPCPPSYPYYIPDIHLCLAKAYPIVYNCQSFTITLGSCPAPKIQDGLSCQPQACAPGYSWDPQTCACVCASGHC